LHERIYRPFQHFVYFVPTLRLSEGSVGFETRIA